MRWLRQAGSVSNVSANFYKDQVALELSAAEALLLARVFDRAARRPDGGVRDAGWLDTSEGLTAAARQIGGKLVVTAKDDEMGISADADGVTMAFDPGIASDIASEIEIAIPEILDRTWYKVSEQINASAKDLMDSDSL